MIFLSIYNVIQYNNIVYVKFCSRFRCCISDYNNKLLKRNGGGGERMIVVIVAQSGQTHV